MIPLNFYRDDEYVYVNNPDGITKKMTIAEFEAVMSGEGGGSGGSLVLVEYDPLTGKINKTWTELRETIATGKICYLVADNSNDAMQDYNVYVLFELSSGDNYSASFYTMLAPLEPYLQAMSFTASTASEQMEIE